MFCTTGTRKYYSFHFWTIVRPDRRDETGEEGKRDMGLDYSKGLKAMILST